jgi:hypothetical protein
MTWNVRDFDRRREPEEPRKNYFDSQWDAERGIPENRNHDWRAYSDFRTEEEAKRRRNYGW